MKEVRVLGIDLAKNIFHVCAMSGAGNVAARKKVSRTKLKSLLTEFAPCLVAMEACGGSHYWGRFARDCGHEVKLIHPAFVKPFVKSNKNDFNDAEAICEAALRPTMRFVSLKSVEQQNVQCLHRVRSRIVKSRTALINEIRGFLLEYGIAIPKSIGKLRSQLPTILCDEKSELTGMAKSLLGELFGELQVLGNKVALYDSKLDAAFRNNETCQRLAQIEGIGPITATAIYASMKDAGGFRNGRQYAASLGLVPRQSSTGGRPKLGRISKRGDAYIRTLLIHGARSWLKVARYKDDRKSRWAKKKLETRGHNKACVAVANKNARVVWALLAKGEEYRAAA